MPYSRPTLSQLKNQVAQDISAALPGADPLLRFSNLGIIGRMLAGLINLTYGFIDWIARQAVPFTATDEYAIGWGGLKGVTLKAATKAGSAGGAVTFINCTVGIPIPAGTPLARGDGFEFVTQALATVNGSGVVIVNPLAVNPGALGNTDVGSSITLGTSIAGIQTTGLVTTKIAGGTDDETMDAFRNRYLQVYRAPPQGGAATDYIKWALEVPGVTRAWCVRLSMGAGTLSVLFMMDLINTGSGGFPVGTNGVASAETRDSAATGDQLTVANYIYGDNTTERQPVTALVYIVAPTPQAINFTIAHISTVSADIKTQINQAIDGVFLEFPAPGGILDLDDIEAAIAAIPGTQGFVITAPSDNVTLGTGALPVRGTVTYT